MNWHYGLLQFVEVMNCGHFSTVRCRIDSILYVQSDLAQHSLKNKSMLANGRIRVNSLPNTKF